MTEWVEAGEGADARRIAALRREGPGPPVVWLGGFRSEMRGTKADALHAWAERTGRAFVRFDYSGHGETGGAFEAGTISRWLEDSLAVLAAFAPERPVLVGSSMGGWLALLATRALRAEAPGRAPAALVLLAPAVDFTEELMWAGFSDADRRTLEADGRLVRPSAYSDEPTVVTAGLIADGRRHLMLGGPIETGCPVRILQGVRDPDVPYGHAMRLAERLPAEAVELTLIPDGDHRLSRPEDIELLLRAVEDAVGAAEAARRVSSG